MENEQRRNAPKILVDLYPKASEEEQKQLQAAVDGGKTIAEGMKEAGKLREKQRQKKKVLSFKSEAITLIDKILDNDELNDVIGSSEGKDEGFFFGEKIRSDVEATAIADINQVRNILTGDNLDIMSGVLSETDIKIISDLAAGALIRTRTEERFIEDVKALRLKLSEGLAESTGTANALPKGVTEDDITTTMEANNMTREQVLTRLGGKNGP